MNISRSSPKPPATEPTVRPQGGHDEARGVCTVGGSPGLSIRPIQPRTFQDGFDDPIAGARPGSPGTGGEVHGPGLPGTQKIVLV